jgi:hypothetical protein
MAKSAAPLLLGLGALALMAGKKKTGGVSGRTRQGVFVSTDCTQVEIRNQERLRNFINGAYRELREADPDLDWFELTDALFGDIAPDCGGYPEDPYSADVADFYAFMLRTVAYKLVEDNPANLVEIFTEDRIADFGSWYKIYAGGPPGDLPENIPLDQVGFSPDFTQVYIGPQWESKTVIPYLQEKVKAGEAEEAIEMFMRDHNAAIGRQFVRFFDLPKQEPNVQTLHQKIQDAFDAVAG